MPLLWPTRAQSLPISANYFKFLQFKRYLPRDWMRYARDLHAMMDKDNPFKAFTCHAHILNCPSQVHLVSFITTFPSRSTTLVASTTAHFSLLAFILPLSPSHPGLRPLLHPFPLAFSSYVFYTSSLNFPMYRQLVRLALRLLRLAGEAFFCFEVNRFLGRAVRGAIRHRLHMLPEAEAHLLGCVRAPVFCVTVTLPNQLCLHTVIAGSCAKQLSETQDLSTLDVGENPLVLLHGHSMAAAHFSRNLDDLLAQGYSAILAPDLPGWGRSSRPLFSGHSVHEAVSFFVSPLHMWADKLGLTRFTLLGHSLGAYVAHELAVHEPLRVSRLILTAPAAVERVAPFKRALWFLFTPQRFLTHGGLMAHMFFAFNYPSTPAYNIAGFRDFTLCSNSICVSSGDAAAAKMLRLVRQGIFSWRGECIRPLVECVTRLNCKVDLIVGDCDELVDVGQVRKLKEELRAHGNDVSMNVITGADHSPHICSPEVFAKVVLRGSAKLVAGLDGAASRRTGARGALERAVDAAGRATGSMVAV